MGHFGLSKLDSVPVTQGSFLLGPKALACHKTFARRCPHRASLYQASVKDKLWEGEQKPAHCSWKRLEKYI